MINKQSLWFITLFSLIIILGIYYFKNDETSLSLANLTTGNNEDVYVSDIANLDVLKITNDEKTMNEINALNDVLLDDEATLEEKNDAYDSIELIADRKKWETKLTSLIKKEFNYEAFVKINEENIMITIYADTHNSEIANNIIKYVRTYMKDNKYITVKFDSK